MPMMLAWDAGMNVIATLDEVRHDGAFLDTVAYEESGTRLRTLWNVNGAVGSGTWPVNLGGLAHDYRVELGTEVPLIVALIHRETGERIPRPVADVAPTG